MNGQVLEEVALSSTALGLLGRLVEGPSPFAAAVPDESPLAEREAIAGLLARGLVVASDDGLALSEELEAVVAVARAADEVLIAEVAADGLTQKVAWLRGPNAALEQAWQAPAGFRLVMAPDREVEERVQSLLALPLHDRAECAAEVTIEAQALAKAMELAFAGALPDVGPDLPDLAVAFVEAVVAGARRCSLDRRTPSPDGRVHGVRLDWIDAGAAGVWSLDRSASRATVRRLEVSELWASILELTAARQQGLER